MLLHSFAFEIWIGIVILSYIFGVIQLYGYYKFNSLRHLIIIQKRYPSLVAFEAIASMINVFISVPLWSNNSLHATHSGIFVLEKFEEYGGFAFTVFTSHFIGNIEAGRLWLMAYELNYLHSFENQQWKTQIDKSFAEKDWFLHNKYKYGNKRYIIKRVFIWYLFAAFISSSAQIITFSIDHKLLFIGQFIDGILYSVPLLITIYTYYKVPKNLNDNFLFHYEFRNTTFLFVTGFIIYFINQAIHLFGFITLSLSLTALLIFWSLAIPSLLSTLWIPRKILLTNTWNNITRRHRLSSIGSNSHPPKSDVIIMTEIIDENDNNKNKSIKQTLVPKLLNTLRTEDKCESFIHWMYREFSSEAIICFIEMVQFKQALMRYIKDKYNKHEIETKSKREYILYDTIPKSSIVYDTNNSMLQQPPSTPIKPMTPESTTKDDNSDNDNNNGYNINDDDNVHWKLAAHLLYKKYIEWNCELEINISSKLRQKYYELDMNRYEIDILELLCIYDDAIEEMFKFMIQSFVRYGKQQQ